MNGNHRYEGIKIVPVDMLPRFDWSRRTLKVVVSIRLDGKPMTRLEFMKTGILLNNVSSHSLPVTEFLEVLASCLRFARAFTATYNTPFVRVRLLHLRTDMVNANFFKGASTSTYNRYIRVCKLCLRTPNLFDFISELNSRPPLQGCKTSTSIGLTHLANNVLLTAEGVVLIRFLVESAWYNLNRSQQPRDRVKFNGTKLYRYAMKMHTQLQEFLVTISDKITSMTDLLNSPLATSSGKVQSVR